MADLKNRETSQSYFRAENKETVKRDSKNASERYYKLLHFTSFELNEVNNMANC